MSDLFPEIGQVADELTIINSMVADSANHTPATFQANTGFRLNGFPVLGSIGSVLGGAALAIAAPANLGKNTAVNAARIGSMLPNLSSGTLRVLPRAAPRPVTL